MPYFDIHLHGTDDDYPTITEVSTFLYDFNFVYEVFRLGTDPEYRGYEFSDQTWSREHRPISRDDQLHIVTLRHESPLLLIAAATVLPGAIGAVWGLLQIVEKIANWPLNRQMLQLQRDKLIADLQKMQLASPHELFPDVETQIEAVGGTFLLDEAVARLSNNRIRVTEFQITVVPKLPHKRGYNRDSPAR